MFEDFTFSFSVPEFIRQIDKITWLALAVMAGGFLLSGYGLVRLLFFSATQSSSTLGEVIQTTAITSTLYIDVSGAVEQPGLYQLQAGDRVAIALEKAGGLTVEADMLFVAEKLNLARRLEDGEKLYIPFAGAGGAAALSDEKSTATQVTSINSATQVELEALPQVGEKRATDIIQNRPYVAITELMDKGIVSEKLFHEIKPFISL